MNHTFDTEVRNALREDPIPVPKEVHQRTEELLASLPEHAAEKKIIHFPKTVQRMVSAAACFVLVMMVVLPNVSVAYAKAVEDIPVIGRLVQVFTIRNYQYFDGNYELEANIPSVNDPDHKESGDLINSDVNELTEHVIAAFYEEMERSGKEGYAGLHITHETLKNAPDWFTLRLTVTESAASSSATVRIYHIDRVSGNYVTFGDLFESESREVLRQFVLADMRARMAADKNASYWEEEPGFAALTEDQNFYFNESGYLVSVYEEYDVAPGYMGAPEFVNGAENLKSLVAPQYAELFDYE